MNLVAACGISFGAVFLLLTVLAGMMRAITTAFPERLPTSDPTMTAAITSTVATLFGGATVTRIEEEES